LRALIATFRAGDRSGARYSKATRERIRAAFSRMALPSPGSSAECILSAPTEEAQIVTLAK
jgi:hypothetical protein